MNAGLVDVDDGSWAKIRQNFARIKGIVGPNATPTLTGLTLTGLTADSLIYPDSNKSLISLGVATNGQLPIGSTGTTPVLATLTGTPNQVNIANVAGSITLSLPQDIHTGASPTFAGLTVVNAVTEFSTDGTMGGDSDSAVPTEKATKLYTDTLRSDLASVANAKGASLIGIEDSLSLYTAADVEAALAEVKDAITVVTTTASSITTVTGTLDSGNVASTQTINDADTYDVSEVSGTPGFDIQATMTGIVSGHEPNLIEGHYSYDGNHTVRIEMWNYTGTPAWDLISDTIIVNTGGALSFFSLAITGTTTDYVSGGESKVRFNHAVAGNMNHDFAIDYLAIKDDHGIGTGITDHGSLSGLSEDDHQQYIKDAEFTQDSGILVGTGAGTFQEETGATLRTSIGVGTGDSPQFTGIELGHASDTTITRASAGVIAVEGTNVMLAGDAPSAHVHDGDTLQLDGINSNGGAFAFTTSAPVTFSQNLLVPLGKKLGIGTTTPVGEIEAVRAQSELLVYFSCYSTNDNHAGRFLFRKSSNATLGTKQETIDGEVLGNLLFYGVNSTPDFVWGAKIEVKQKGAVSGVYVPSQMLFTAVSSATGYNTNQLVLDGPTGYVGIGLEVAKTKLTVEGALTLKEQAAADGDTAAYGQIWVKDDAPCSLYFTGDTGVDTKLNLIIGTDVQAYDAGLSSLAALSYVSASFVKMTGANTFALRTIGETADDLEGTIDHNQTANYDANKHIDHTDVTLTAGTGLTGGGDISAGRTFAVDGVLEDLDTLGAPASNGQFIVATGAGVFAYESTTTARTSLGVGEADVPFFGGIQLRTVGLTKAVYSSSGAVGVGRALFQMFRGASDGSDANGWDFGYNLDLGSENFLIRELTSPPLVANTRLTLAKGSGDMTLAGNINATGVYKIDSVQVVGNRVIDARCDDAINSGDATTDGVIDSLRDAMITHGLVAAA